MKIQDNGRRVTFHVMTGQARTFKRALERAGVRDVFIDHSIFLGHTAVSVPARFNEIAREVASRECIV